MGFNKVLILAQIIVDPRIQYRDNGDAFCVVNGIEENFIKSADGVIKKEIKTHRFYMIAQVAETFAKIVSKNDNILFEGKIEPIQKIRDGKAFILSEFRITHFTQIQPRQETNDVVSKRVDEEIQSHIEFEDLK
jgi:hypothetical protein